MDALSTFLAAVRTDGSFVSRVVGAPPWRSEIVSEELTMVTALRGELTLTTEGGDRHLVTERAVALVTRPGRVVLGDVELSATEPVTPCDLDDGRALIPAEDCGVAAMVSRFRLNRSRAARVLAALPEVAVVPDEGKPCPILDVIAEEWQQRQPGRQLVLDRSSDVLLLIALREWFAREEATPPRWYVALGDPVVGPALRAIHAEPERAWTVGSLAATAPASRTTFAQRFTAVVGESPIAYLTGWRMAIATDLLADTSLTTAEIARRVGYANAFAFSHAYTRHHGVRPSEHRGSGLGVVGVGLAAAQGELGLETRA